MKTPIHIVFVDLENVPVVDLGAVERKPIQVTLLIGKKQTKLALPLVQQIHRLAAQVALVEVGASGRNALDLTLACYLGRALEQRPEAQFAIVSRDKDFDAMIDHLQGKGVKIVRCDSFAELPFLPQPKKMSAASRKRPAIQAAVAAKKTGAIKVQPEDRRAKVIARLKNPGNRNRPGTAKALQALIKNALGKTASEAAVSDVMQRVQSDGVLVIDGTGKVVYRSQS